MLDILRDGSWKNTAIVEVDPADCSIPSVPVPLLIQLLCMLSGKYRILIMVMRHAFVVLPCKDRGAAVTVRALFSPGWCGPIPVAQLVFHEVA